MAVRFQNAKQGGGFITGAASKVPVTKFIVRFCAKEAPRHHAAGINKVFNKVVGLRHGHAVKRGRGQVVQAFKAAAL